MSNKNKHAQALGRIKSEAKTRAARENGRRGGRPPIDIEPMVRDISDRMICPTADEIRSKYPREWAKAKRLRRIRTWRDDTGAEYVEIGQMKPIVDDLPNS